MAAGGPAVAPWMEALFGPDRRQVAWLQPGAFVFDLELNPVACLGNGHAWSFPDMEWLGPMDEVTPLDREGRPVAFHKDRQPQGRLRPSQPMRPMRPLPPRRPLRPPHPHTPAEPLPPFGGWSQLTFAEWLRAGRPSEDDLQGLADEAGDQPDDALAEEQHADHEDDALHHKNPGA